MKVIVWRLETLITFAIAIELLLASSVEACSHVARDDFIGELLALSSFYEAARYDRSPEPIKDERKYDDALFLYDPTLSAAFRKEYVVDFLLEANALRGIAQYLKDKYPEAPSMIAASLRQESLGIYTVEDILAGKPAPQYDPDNPPLWRVLGDDKFCRFEEFQFRLLGNMGESGLLESVGLDGDFKDRFSLGPYWTWYEMGDDAVQLFIKLKSEGRISADIEPAVDQFISEWQKGDFRGLQRHYPWSFYYPGRLMKKNAGPG